MMTRNDVAKLYTLDERGVVTNPGKFKHKPWYVVALWDASLEGCADREEYDGDIYIACFAHDDEIANMLGVDVNFNKFVCVWERSDGFVFLDTYTERQLDSLSDSEGE